MSTAGYLLHDTGYELSLHLIHSSLLLFGFCLFFICVHPAIFTLCNNSVSFCKAIAQFHKLSFNFWCQSICLLSDLGGRPSQPFLSPPHLPVLLPVADRQKCQLCLGLRALCHEFNTAVQVQYTWIVQLLLMNQNLTLQRAGN